MMRIATVIVWATSALAAAAIATMTPKEIRGAIAFGMAEKTMPTYALRKPGFVGANFKPVLGSFSTPFLRVAQSAHAAQVSFKTFAEADVTPDLIAPELHVFGFAQSDRGQVVNVQQILITKKGSKEPAAAIRPSRSEPIPVTMRNLYGFKGDGESLFAVFPIDALRDGSEIHVIYDGRVHDGAPNKYCEDCAVEIDMAKIR